jgi:hypothetical protein
MTTVWVVVARWCDDGWPVAVFATEERAWKRADALARLGMWAWAGGHRWSKMERGELWHVEPAPFRDA